MTATERIDAHLEKIGITTPTRRRAVRKSRDYSELWAFFLVYRKTNPNVRITAKPDADGFFRVYARPA